MKLGSIVGGNSTKVLRTTYNAAKPQQQPVTSVRAEVLARRKKQKDFDLLDMIKTNIENRIAEKLKDILGIRF